MDEITENYGGSCKPNANWCCIMDNLPTGTCVGDGPAPVQPTKLFEWLAAKNLPQIENESPPASFYEVLETADIAFHCSRCDKLLISVHARTLGTQTQLYQLLQAQTQTTNDERRHAVVQAQTQTPKLRLIQVQTQTELELEPQYTAFYRRPLPIIRKGFVWIRGQSPWMLLKGVLLAISLGHSCFIICRAVCHIQPLRQMLMTAPEPLVLPPPQRSLPGFVWHQVCRLGRALHLI